MKFLLFVEGQTEKGSLGEFLKRWFDTRLPSPVKISIVTLRGVGNYSKNIRRHVEFYLEAQANEQIIAAVGLVDLSGSDFPPHIATKSTKDKVGWKKNEFEKLVAHPKFRQYFAVHETEAWVLAHQEILPRAVREALPGGCPQPESVNMNEPPSKLLGRLYQSRLNRQYKKVIDGKKLFLDCDPKIVAEKCPHFAQMLAELERLAIDAGRK